MQREERIEYLDPSEIKPDPNQPRQTWTDEDRKEIESMVESLKEHGVIEPIEADENNVMILGERRWNACKIAGVKVPVRRKVGLSPSERFERQIVADTQRKELSPMDRAWAYATAVANINTGKDHTVKQVKGMNKETLLKLVSFGDGRKSMGQAELSRRTGIPQQTISVYLRTVGLEPELQKAVETGKLPITTFRQVDKLKEENLRKELQKTIIREVKNPDVKKVVRTDIDEIVDFVNKPEIQHPITRQQVSVELSKEDKKALVQRKITPHDIEVREISKALQPSPEAQHKIQEAIEKTREEIQRIKEIPEVKERGRWYQNWLAHGALAQSLDGAFCPICGSTDSFGWLCHNLELVNAYKKVTEEYQKRMK